MSLLTTPAILLRRTDYGDFDIIVTVFTLVEGKLSLIVKSGKKSKKRFAGVLELFSELEIVARRGRRGGLSVLQEANLREPFGNIRSDIQKTAYASYWVELVNAWMEAGVGSRLLFDLLRYVLGALDRGADGVHALSILFQIQFLKLSGHSPNFDHCGGCRTGLEELPENPIAINLSAGGIVCRECGGQTDSIQLSRATIKQLLWVQSGDLNKAGRIRFNSRSTREALTFLEAFVPYHLGRQPKSLKFLRQIRRGIE